MTYPVKIRRCAASCLAVAAAIASSLRSLEILSTSVATAT